MSWFISKLAFREISRRKGQALLIIVGLMICTAVITASLVVGDSMEYLVYQSTYDNLGEVDMVIQSGEFFDYKYYEAIAKNESILQDIDKHAPMIQLSCSLEASKTKLRENNANLYGIDQQFNTFGSFKRESNGKTLTPSEYLLGKDELIINEPLASKLNLEENTSVNLFISNPAYSIDTVYRSSEGKNTIEQAMTVKIIVEHEGLGRLQLNGRTQDSSNIFMDLIHLQELLGTGDKINTILISNKGDKYSGIDKDETVEKKLSQCLDASINYEDVGFELNHTDSNYLRLLNDDIFFDNDVYEISLRFKENYQESSQNIYSSPVLTYFVNSLYLERTNQKSNYSIVTGLAFSQDQSFGKFDIIRPAQTEHIILEPDEIILLDWTAEQLGATLGDTITIDYMALDRYYNIYNTTKNLTVKYIIGLSGKPLDPLLMPSFPGLSDELDCVNWQPPSFPINVSWITKADRDFWFSYQGTPKAYINIETAQSLWGNNLGSLSMVKLGASYNMNSTQSQKLEELKQEIGPYLDSKLGHSNAGMIIDRVKSDSLATASGMTIFPMMFLAFSSAIILAGMVLIVTIFLILAEARKSDFGLGRAIGLSKNRVVKLYMIEGSIYGILAGIIGMLVGLLLGWGLVEALNSIWSAAVQNYEVPFYYTPLSLVYGFIAGFGITLITIFITARHIANKSIISNLYDIPEPEHARLRFLNIFGLILLVLGTVLLILGLSNKLSAFVGANYYLQFLGPVLTLLGVGFIGKNLTSNNKTNRLILNGFTILTLIYTIIFSILTFPKPDAPTTALFFMIGLVLVLTFIILLISNLRWLVKKIVYLFNIVGRPSYVANYSIQNPTRRPTRTGLSITIFTLVIFLIAALSINISIQRASVDVVSYEERGGYDILAETSVPLSIDLENSTQRLENNIEAPVFDNITMTEILVVGPPGGTCSNMNTHYPPRLLGVGHDFVVENAFRFQSTLSGTKDHSKTWFELEKNMNQNNGKIPIVVDYNTLVWIYNGELGKVYEVEDETGATVELEVIGVLENTVFGGTFVMSEENLETLYPTTAEYKYALIKLKSGTSESPEHVAHELERELYMYGFDAQSIKKLINENREYERSFMVLFQAFLALGLIIGMVGLGAITARSVSERRYEIGVLRAIGFTREMILKSFIIEISFITILAIILGLILGLIASFLAFGAWTGGNYEFVLPCFELIFLGLIIYFVALLSAIYPAYRASRLTPDAALRRVG